MLETVITLGIGAGVIQVLNRVKQSRLAKRELRKNYVEIQERFADEKDRDVVQLTLFMSPEEQHVIGTIVETVLSGRDITLTKGQAAAVLHARELAQKKPRQRTT